MTAAGQSQNDSTFLLRLGWDDARAQEFCGLGSGIEPGRVCVQHKGQYGVLISSGEEVPARIKGQLRYNAESWAELPAVGDWVAVNRREHEHLWRIQHILQRRTHLSRKKIGEKTTAQLLATNITHCFIVMGLTEDFNVRRLERYLVICRESGATPVVILNKSDLLESSESEEKIAAATACAPGAAMHVVSALQGDGVETVKSFLRNENTIIFIGSSGAGKSTLVNAIAGDEIRETGEVRELDGRGRHTTTSREMILLPGGGVLIDTPGLREIQVWDAEQSLDKAFGDIEEMATGCKFGNCSHTSEPGCAVLKALEDGTLDMQRLDNYRRIQKESASVATRRQRQRDVHKKAFKTWKP